jgi:translation initiation factor IF-3
VYERQRAAKQQSKAARSKTQPTRELRLRVGIADRDFEAKVMQARTLLVAGANIRLSVEIGAGQQRHCARDLADRFADAARDAATAVVPPQEGENETVVVMWAAPRLG